MPRKATSSSTQRLKQDYIRLQKDPVPYVTAQPLPSNILEWHYVVKGPEGTPYEGGYYHGKLVFPHDYPFKPPAIYMITPNGRFKCNIRLCLSISDFHPDTWNPAWSVSTILTGLLSFMVETAPTLGSVETSDAQKRVLARASLEFNLADQTFVELLPETTAEIRHRLLGEAERHAVRRHADYDELETTCNSNVVNLCIIVGFAAFAYTAWWVIEAAGSDV